MELISAVHFQPFEKVKEIAESMKIFTDPDYSDYHALNLALFMGRRRTANYLINSNCRVNIESKKSENTPLHCAIELGDKQLVCDLLMKKASISAMNHEGNSPLHLSFLKRYDEITELILNVMFVHKFYDYVNIKNAQDLSHLHIACTVDNEKLVQLFLDVGANLNDAVKKDSPYCAGYTAMHFAVKNQCIEVAKFILDTSGLSIISEGKDSQNRTPVQLAYDNLKNFQILFYHLTQQNLDSKWGYCQFLSQFHMACLGDYPDMVESFITYGVAVNTPVQQEAIFCPGYTPLHCAVESNCKENVDLLLENGADVEQTNHNNMTALHLALYNENQNEKNTIVDLLYSVVKDKKQNLTDLNNLSYMHIAVTRDDRETVKKLLKIDKTNVNRAVMYNLRKFSGFTPLHFAVYYKHLEMANLLIRHGANVNTNDDLDYGTPLHLAFQVGQTNLIDLLLLKGARADISRVCDDKTMLHLLVDNYMNQSEARAILESNEGNVFHHWNVKDNMLEYIEQLVGLRCDVNGIESEDGNTALHLACSNFWDGAPCVKKLLEFGADINIENYLNLTAFQSALNGRYHDNGEDYMMLYHHVQKLKALGLEVNVKNLKCCDEILKKKNDWEKQTNIFPNNINYFSDEELARKHQERLDEIAKMKDFKLDKQISLYDFVRLDSNQSAAAYVQNKALTKLFSQKDANVLSKQYASYAYLIKLRYRKAVEYFILNRSVKKISVVAKRTRRGCQTSK